MVINSKRRKKKVSYIINKIKQLINNDIVDKDKLLTRNLDKKNEIEKDGESGGKLHFH